MADYDSRKRKPPEYPRKGTIHMKKWTNTNPMRRLLSLALSMAMVLTLLPMPSIAAEGDGLCEHHPEHTGCGYVAAVEGHDCGHVCGEECYTVTTDCQHVHDESCYSDGVLPAEGEEKAADACAHTACTEESGCVTKAHTCTHKHDGSCGYVEAVAGSPCTYQCEICADARVESQPEKTVISAWEWDDGYEIVDEKSGYVVLPFTGEEFTASFEQVKGMLPEAILVGEEALTLGNWTYETGEEGAVVTIDSESCPSPGIFKTTLPEGYVLADGTNVLSLTVALSAGSSEDTSSYANSDTLTNVSYYDADGTLKTCPSATIVTDTPDVEGGNTITWGKPGMTTWYAVNNSRLPIGDSDDKWTIYVKGDVHLIMMQGSWLCMYGQIEVLKGDSLTVYCDNTSNSGTLQVWGAINHAAIGGSVESPDSGKITINSGTVTASTGNGGAGIGSGEGGSAGDITINGGIIDAKAVNGGAGIGIGKNGKSATITINNCNKINARSSSGAGIGSGEESSGTGKVTVNINDGTGIISKSASGAGIGSGKNAPLSVDVNINGGDIYAQTTGQGDPPNHGAAIGGGYGATNTTVNIGGSANVEADGGKTAPGIGSIDPGGCSVTISGGTVKAKGGEQGAGIGGASNRNSCPVTITGGTVTATGGATGAGIGSGCGGNSTTNRYTTGNIAISGGTVTAKGGYFAAGIGGGEYNTAGDILISGGTVIATRDTSKDNDSSIYGGRFDIGDGFIFINNTPVHARYTLNGSAKLYLQSGFSISEYTARTSGYIFNGTPETYKEIQVYGSQTLNEDFCIETGKKMTVTNGASLNANSKLYVKGTLAKEGTGSASGNIYYPLTLTNCTAGSNNTSLYNDELFGKANAAISLTPALQSGYKLDGWTVTPNTVTVSSNSFNMPNQATTVQAKGTQVLQITQQPQNQEITYGADATLSVTAKNDSGGTDEITYQWYKGTEKLPNETFETLSLKYLDASTQPYSFYCEVSCNGVSINSNTATVTVNKAQASVTITGDPGKTYDGTPVATPYTVSGGGYPKIEYKLQSETVDAYTETPPTDAGEYTVRVTMSENQNYEGASATKDFTISKATDNAWQTEPSVTNFTYGDTATNPVKYQALYGDDNVVVTYKKRGTEGTSSTTVPTEAGTYDVTVSLADTASYPGLPDVSLTLTISPRSIAKPSADTTAFTYTGEPQTYTLDGSEWYTITGNTRTDAGSQTVTVALKDKQNTQWGDGTTDDVTFPFAIAKAESSVTKAPEDAKSLYTGSPVPLVTAGTVQGGTMQYSLDGETWSADIPTATDWKTYTVYYKVVGDGNHTDTEAQTLTAEIVPFKIDGQSAKVTNSYGDSPWMYVDLKTQLSEQISYQWYQVTDEGDVELTDATENELTILKPIADNYTFVCKITCGDYFKYSDPITVTVNPAQVENVNLSGYWAEGGEWEIAKDETVELTNPNSRLLTKYTEGKNTQGDPYPAGMQIYSVEKDDQGQTVVVPVAELDNLLQYSGCSIRINGKPGIRMITSLTKEAKELLKKGELAGYTLEEYGTVVAWSNELGSNPLTLSTGRSNYAYRKGVSDPVFANVGNMTQYTNVLVWDSLPDAQLAQDILMRPYIILSKDGETVTLYGGTVSRSIYYVAQQNANTFPVGSAGYKYVHDIIDKVTNLPGGNGE